LVTAQSSYNYYRYL